MTKQATEKVTFLDPIPYGGDKELKEITIRPPMAGDLRGVNIEGIAQMRVDDLLKLLPRIAIENVSEVQLNALSARDVTKLFHAVQPFFMPE